MSVTLDYEKLTKASNEATSLAEAIRTNATSARAASPVDLPSLEGIETKATWLEEQAAVLDGLADIAVLLDASGEGTVTMSLAGMKDKLNDLLGEYIGSEFGNIFGNDEDFPLISLATALGKMWRMSHGVAPIFQTGIVGRTMLEKMIGRGGRAGEWARWMLQGPRHMQPPAGLLKTPKWVTAAGSRLPSGGWSPTTLGGKLTGLGAMRALGVAGGVYNTATGLVNLYEQGNPVEAFKRDGAGYVADVAETAFSASTTAFLIAPNPVTAGLAVGTGLVWAGAEVVDHWDDITETASDLKDKAGEVWDDITPW